MEDISGLVSRCVFSLRPIIVIATLHEEPSTCRNEERDISGPALAPPFTDQVAGVTFLGTVSSFQLGFCLRSLRVIEVV